MSKINRIQVPCQMCGKLVTVKRGMCNFVFCSDMHEREYRLLIEQHKLRNYIVRQLSHADFLAWLEGQQ